MAEIDHFAYGLVTPAFAYALSALGALLGLACTARARAARTTRRRAWFLLLAAWAIGGTGIWAMHFIAMLGFGVAGTEIRYDVPLTTVSAILAVTVVGIGLFAVGFGRVRPAKIMLGGGFTGLGVATMHYTGMAAMRIDGVVRYDNLLVAASVLIAVVAATAALWFTVTVRRPLAIVGSALVMGLAVCGMHYTGMYAMEIHVHDTGGSLTGSTAFALILPIILLVIFVVLGLVYAVVAAPTEEDLAGEAYLAARRTPEQATPDPAGGRPAQLGSGPAVGPTGRPGEPGGVPGNAGSPPGAAGRPPGTAQRRLNADAFHGIRRQAIPRARTAPESYPEPDLDRGPPEPDLDREHAEPDRRS